MVSGGGERWMGAGGGGGRGVEGSVWREEARTGQPQTVAVLRQLTVNIHTKKDSRVTGGRRESFIHP